MFYVNNFHKGLGGKFPPDKNFPENAFDNFGKPRKFFRQDALFHKISGKIPINFNNKNHNLPTVDNYIR